MPDLEFTGERAVPGKIDPQLEFEHFSRYRFASQWAAGKSVIDLGCGAGYGAALLKAAGAERVVGVDIAFPATLFARATYGAAGLSFITGDCADQSLRSGSADLVTAFEIIEHLAEYRRLLAFARDLLAEGGLFVVSTPNKRVYSDERQAPLNPFHVKEFYCDEFRSLLNEFFPHVVMLGQSTTEGMLFAPLEGSTELKTSLPNEAKDASLSETTDFFVAICGFGQAVATAGTRSEFMASSGNELRRRTGMINALQAELEDRTGWAKSLDAQVDEKKAEISEKNVQLAAKAEEVARKTGRLSDLERELAERQMRTAEIEAEAERSRVEVAELRQRLEERLRVARKLKREVAERDRQFLLRLRDLERLEARTRHLELDRENSEQLRAALAARVEVAGGLISELEDQQAGQEALLGWHQDSLAEQARKVHASEVDGQRLDRLTKGLEEASYQHQIGLDYHSQQVAQLTEQLERLRQESERQAGELTQGQAANSEIRALLDNRPWRSDSLVARAWRRLRSLTVAAAEPGIEPRLEEAVRSLASSSKPLLTIALAVDGDVGATCDSVSSIADSNLSVDCEVLILGTDRGGSLNGALKASSAGRYIRVKQAGDVAARAAAAARGEYVLCMASGVVLESDTIECLLDSFASSTDIAIVGPALITAEDAEQLAFGGERDASGQPRCLGQGGDREGLEYSFAQPTGFVPGACFMARRSLLERLARSGEDSIGTLAGAAALADRVRDDGSAVYVQPRASAQVGGQVRDLLEAAAQSSEARVPELERSRLAFSGDRGPRLLVIDHRLPTPDQDSGSLRMSHMFGILQELGCRLALIPADGLPIQPYCGDLQASGVEVVARPWVASPLDYIVDQAHRFDGAIVCRSDVADEFMDTVRASFIDKPVIFDTVDLQFLREGRRAELEGDPERAVQAEAVQARELATARRADVVLVVSDFEAELLGKHAPEVDVRLVSNIHHVPGRTSGFRARKDLFFVGGFEHQPNVDAVRWLVEEILPLVRRKMPNVHTYIIGSKPTAEVRAMASESVTIKGYQPDLAPFLGGCRLSVAPLRYGAGVKGKVNQSLAHGVPCVMTPMAAEGMGLSHGFDAMIGETAEEFAAAVVRAYRNPWLWRRLSRNGVRNTRQRFSVEVARSAVRDLLNDQGLIGADRASARTTES